jgi:hypothetical protein
MDTTYTIKNYDKSSLKLEIIITNNSKPQILVFGNVTEEEFLKLSKGTFEVKQAFVNMNEHRIISNSQLILS